MRVWVILFVLLAGCVEPERSDDSEDAEPEMPSIPAIVTMHDCYEQGGSFPAEAASYQGRLPDGFTPSPYTGFNSFPREPTGDSAELFVIVSLCHDDEGVAYHRGFVALFVDPPEDLVDPEAAFGHLFLLSYTSDSVDHQTTWAAWGLGAEQGAIVLDLEDSTAMRAGTAEVTGNASFNLGTTVEGAAASMEANRARFFAGDTGSIGITDAEFGALEVHLGHATLQGSEEAGVVDGPLQGVALHAYGHDNIWRPFALE